MELESQRAKLEARGLKVAAVSYDSVEILREFARRKSIGFPLLSDADPGGEVITRTFQAAGVRRIGLKDVEAFARSRGIPFEYGAAGPRPSPAWP